MAEESRPRTVLVTGFGPFGDYNVNASWEAVKQLERLCANSKELADVKLVITEVPVSYDAVAGLVPRLWEEHNPIVVLHVGVSGKADRLTIEYQAHSTGYERLDVNNKAPDEAGIVPRLLQTNLNVKQICNTVNNNEMEQWDGMKHGCKACISHNAGRYLCEYIFYRSLCIDPSRVLFIHVPDFASYPSSQTAQGLFVILCSIVESLRCNQQ